MASSFLSDPEKKEIAVAIQQAEKDTIGEIRVYIEKKSGKEALERAFEIFQRLKMHDTKERTGVLLYIAHDDRQLAIIGDKGIHEKVPENFWDNVKEAMMGHFREGNFSHGLKHAIEICGVQLKTHFPAKAINPNELSDDVVIGDE